MQATVGKWGNNLAVRLPREIVEAVRLRDGERLDIQAQGGVVTLRRIDPATSLSDMFSGKTPEDWRAEYAGGYDWGPDVGREIIPE